MALGTIIMIRHQLRDTRALLHLGISTSVMIYKAYVNTLSAMKNFCYRTRQSLPYKVLKIVTRTVLHGGTPYATTNKIRIPRGFNYNWRTARHEFAHTMRQTLVS